MIPFFTRLFHLIFTPFFNAKARKIQNLTIQNEVLLRMLSLESLDKVAKRFDFHSTFLSRSNFTRLRSTPVDSIDKVAKRPVHANFCRVKNRMQNRIVWPGLYSLAPTL